VLKDRDKFMICYYDIIIVPIMIISNTDNDTEAASTEMYNIISHY